MIKLLKALVILGLVGSHRRRRGRGVLFPRRAPEAAGRAGTRRRRARRASRRPTRPRRNSRRAEALKPQRSISRRRTRRSEAFLTRYPDSSHRDEAETLLGDINYSELLSAEPGPGKMEYIVQRGDVLDRVAHKTKSDPELIFQANGLDRIMLRIGQKLRDPAGGFFHRGPPEHEESSCCSTTGKFFKSYAIQDARPLPKKVPEIHTKVQEKLATNDGRRVPSAPRTTSAACVR